VSDRTDETGGRTRMWRFRHVATRYLNPVMCHVVRRLPGFGLVIHSGRTTGRTYRTPVNVFRRGDTYLFFLTYGADAQWVKNILAAGSCSLETRGRVVHLVDPEVIIDPGLRVAPPVVRFIERRVAGASQYLQMHARST
jgi:deazaflavin-dependent oxidoreductase (nitroreductase family)